MTTTYYPIDEAAARRAKEANSFSDYAPGSATASYRAAVDEAAALVENRKARTSEYYHATLDRLLDTYARRLAEWQNSYNRNSGSCPSVLICGAGNFPTRKKNKQNAREDALWAEYKTIEALIDKIKRVGTGPVDLNDPNAREALTATLDKYTQRLEIYKAVNAYYRKNKTCIGCPSINEELAQQLENSLHDDNCAAWLHGSPFPAFELQSVRGKIKRTQERIAELDKLQAAQAAPADDTTGEGWRIVRNAEQNRLQILFDEIPDADTRAALKSNGFRWSPRNQAWQRQLTDNAERAARQVLCIQ